MTLFQTISMWALRALAVWLVFEGASIVYDRISVTSEKWDAIATLDERLSRLGEELHHARTNVHKGRDKIAALQSPIEIAPEIFAVDPAGAAQRALRDELVAAGAGDVVVKASLRGPGQTPIAFDATWTERREESGRALNAFAIHHPHAAIVSLNMALSGDQSVHSTVRFKLLTSAKGQRGS